jgi:deazaflavin-dependent oxidoreductase (nitroreductase family)
MSFTDSIIEEFRRRGGEVTRPYPDSTLVLVTLHGAKSGREMTLPLEYMEDGGNLYVFGTKGGSPTDPAWVYNLHARPEIRVEYLTEQFPAVAREVSDSERDRLWRELVARKPRFGEYEQKTTRAFPVFQLVRDSIAQAATASSQATSRRAAAKRSGRFRSAIASTLRGVGR